MLMQAKAAVHPADARIARMLVGCTVDELAALAGVGAMTVKRFEAGDRTLYATRSAILEALALAGARFHARGDVRHVDGRQAPTRKAMGALRGDRLLKARRQLRLSSMEVSGRAHLTTRTLARLEQSPHDLTQAPTMGFVRLVGVLQLAGYLFEPWRHNRVSGDRLLIEPPPAAKARKDRSRYHTKGLVIPGLQRALEGEDVPE